MKKETIVRIKLTASEGHILTNGKEYGKIVYLASGDEGADWWEIADAEYERIMKESENENTAI